MNSFFNVVSLVSLVSLACLFTGWLALAWEERVSPMLGEEG